MSAPEDNFPPIDSPGDLPAEGGQSADESLRPSSQQVPAAEAQAGVPEDLRTPWAWGCLALFIAFAVGSLVSLEMVFEVYALAKLHLNWVELQKLATSSALFIGARQAVWFGGLMLYLYLMVRLRHHAPFWRTIGWRPLPPHALSGGFRYATCVTGGVGLAFANMVANKWIPTKGTPPIEKLFHDRQGALVIMTLAILAAPLVEETVFRGYIYPVLARSFGVPAGVFATGVLFGLIHAEQLRGAWGQLALLMIVGIVFTFARARTGTVLASYLLHLSYNSTLCIGFYFGTEGLRRFPDAFWTFCCVLTA